MQEDWLQACEAAERLSEVMATQEEAGREAEERPWAGFQLWDRVGGVHR